MKYLKLIAILILLATSGVSAFAGEKEGFKILGSIPILHNGRVKPMDSYAREIVRSVTGSHRWEKQLPIETVIKWMSDPETAYNTPMVPVQYLPLKETISLEKNRKYFSMAELMGNEGLRVLAMQASQANQDGRDLTTTQQKAMDLFNALGTLKTVFTGESMTIVPGHTENAGWTSMAVISADSSEMTENLRIAWSGLMLSYKNQNWDIFERSVKVLKEELAGFSYDPQGIKKIDAELFYNSFQPLVFAKIFYVLALSIMLFSLAGKLRFAQSAAYSSLLIGFLFHTAALGLRFYIGGRAPWSNMYESITTAGWGVLLFAIIPQKGLNKRIILPVSAIIGFLTLLIASHVSLNPAINPLVPALQSIWLNIHVIVILLGYSACTLAMGAGHAWIAVDVFNPGNRQLLNSISNAIYRMFQFAVLLLIVGIILGSVWANAAWGRYWGWDPKETWALITWIFYLGIVHAHLSGWIRKRGLAVTSLIGFLLVLVTYYGVNYFLVGLHSYADGESLHVPPLIIAFVIIEVGILIAYYLHTKRSGSRLSHAGKKKEPVKTITIPK